jgi:hypothetical protein
VAIDDPDAELAAAERELLVACEEAGVSLAHLCTRGGSVSASALRAVARTIREELHADS